MICNKSQQVKHSFIQTGVDSNVSEEKKSHFHTLSTPPSIKLQHYLKKCLTEVLLLKCRQSLTNNFLTTFLSPFFS